MARTTLKLGKPAAVAASRMPSSRASRAHWQRNRHKPPAPVADVQATAKLTTPGEGATDPERRASGNDAGRRPVRAKALPRTGKQLSAKGSSPRTGQAGPGPKRGADRRNAGPAGAVAKPDRGAPPRPGNAEEPRLSKRMSELGLCSRREADEWIENGWVKVDGVVVDQLGARVSRAARIDVDPAAARHQGEQVTILLHKPIGHVSGQAEDGHTPASVLLTPEHRWAGDPSGTRFRPAHLRGLAPAGRLDIDSSGLLVFTQDGRVAKRLIGSHSEVEKEYLVRVEGRLDDAGMRLLQHGLELDGVKLRPARVSWQNEDQLRFVLREGRKRQIRRMCELVGLVVTGLKRVRIGSVTLGPLPPGQWRYLGPDEQF